MSLSHSPSIITDNLLLSIDPANQKSYSEYENLYTYSQDFSQATWIKNANVAFTSNAAISPDGTTTATKMVLQNTWTGEIPIYRQISPLLNMKYTMSVYLKAAEWNYAYFWFDNGAGLGCTFEINLITGATRNTRIGDNTSFTSFSTSSTSVGNGWYRVSITATTTASATNLQFRIYPSNTAWVSGNFGTPTPTPDGTSGIYFWGAQLEKNTSMSTYKATTTSEYTKQTALYNLKDSSNFATAVNPIYDSNSLYYNAYSTYIDTGYKFLRNYDNGTLIVWTKPNNIGVIGHYYYEGSGGDGFGGEIESHMTIGNPVNSASFWLLKSDNTFWTSTGFPVTNGTWFQTAVTYSFNTIASTVTLNVYFNGISYGSATVTPNRNYTGGNALLGKSEGYGVNPARSFNGNIGNFSFYNRVLSQNEIMQNFNALRGRYSA